MLNWFSRINIVNLGLVKAMKKIIFFSFLLIFNLLKAQFGYEIIGNTYGVSNINNVVCGEIDSCFTLTDNIQNQGGAVWDNKPINLNYSFDASFCMTLGSNDQWGADGFAFVMRGLNSDSIGMFGRWLGFSGIVPSVAIEFDTWENQNEGVNDIAADHTGMYFNSDYVTPAVSAVPLKPNSSNVEDGGYHVARIVWDATNQIITMYFDGIQRFTNQTDLINVVFNGENIIKWGFTASTGGVSNLQQICFPKYVIETEDVYICPGDTAEVSFYDPNMTSYTWTYEDGTVIKNWNSLDFVDPFDLDDTVFYTTQTGTYYLDIEINNQSIHDSVVVAYAQFPTKPFADKYDMACLAEDNFSLNAQNAGSSYLWSTGQTTQQITITNPGTYFVKINEPLNSCENQDTITIFDFCKDTTICSGDNASISFYVDNLTSYKWTFEDGTVLRNWNTIDFSTPFNQNDSLISISQAGTYFIDFTIENQLLQDSLELTVIAKPAKPFPLSELTACLEETALQLNALNSGSFYLWSTGDTLQEISVSTPGTYFVEITEPNLICSNSDTVTVFSICQTVITFPNIFSPDGDQINDFYTLMLSNSFEWLVDFDFEIYNRWGEKVYQVSKEAVNWDGKLNGTDLSQGVYFYKCSYTDLYTGETHLKQGNIQLMR